MNPGAKAMADTESNKAIVADFFETFSKGDVPGVIDRMHDEGSWWVSGAIERMSGTYPKAALAGLLDGARALYREGALHITPTRSEEHTSELQSRMRTSYPVFCLKKQTDGHTAALLRQQCPRRRTGIANA